jgi:hypothetical protein
MEADLPRRTGEAGASQFGSELAVNVVPVVQNSEKPVPVGCHFTIVARICHFNR